MLFLIPTPIGNLADITYRAIDTLKKVDLILCEDTRKSRILLNHYNIVKPLKSFHKFNEKSMEKEILKELAKGKNIAVISDAGTPGISDPGNLLINRCIQENIPFTSLPGPSAPITALCLSGFGEERFQFLGFLPKKSHQRKMLLIETLFYPGVSIFFESPQRMEKTLKEIHTLSPKQNLAIAREISKIHEECLRGNVEDFLEKSFRGEIVLILEGKKQPQWNLSLKDHVLQFQKEFNLTKEEAIKLVASLRMIPKKKVYSCLISPEKL